MKKYTFTIQQRKSKYYCSVFVENDVVIYQCHCKQTNEYALTNDEAQFTINFEPGLFYTKIKN